MTGTSREVYKQHYSTTLPKTIDDGRKAKIVELYVKDRIPIKFLSQRFGHAEETIRKIIKAAGANVGCANRRDE